MKEKIIAHKKHIVLIALAVILLFCLWYTRPKSWSDLAGEYGEIQEVSAGVRIWWYDDALQHQSQSYSLRVDGNSDTAKGLLVLLENNRYRPMLQTIFPRTSIDGGDYSACEINAATLSVDLIYGDTVVYMSVMGNRLCFGDLNTNGFRAYTIQDPSLSDALSRFIMEHGTLDE